MDLLLKWNQILRNDVSIAEHGAKLNIADQVQELLQLHLRLWWSCEGTFPKFRAAYSANQQKGNQKMLGRMIDGLVYELKHIPVSEIQQVEQVNRLKAHGLELANQLFALEPRHIDFIESSGLLSSSQEFARTARAFDPMIHAQDIYQASRNVMTMNFMQLLLDLPVEVTPSVFAYSMLYPYSDNYLDDPAIPRTTKLAFIHRFQQWLEGEKIKPANQNESRIYDLVGMIESQWNRQRFPNVYESLLAIHMAQVRSLELAQPNISPYEHDVLSITFEKGGTSVLADGYLVAGDLLPEQARLMFGYGAFTQLMDDMEDIHSDLHDGQATIFSQTTRHWPLDNITNRVFHFGRKIFSDLSAFPSPSALKLKELIEFCIDPLLIDSAGQNGRLYTRDYLSKLEHHFPLSFDSLRHQRERLNRQKINLERLIEEFALRPAASIKS